MFMNLIPELMDTSHLARILILVVSLMPVARTHAQPVIVSTDPASGATGNFGFAGYHFQ